MENIVIRTRFKIIYESTLSCIESAQSTLKKLSDGEGDINNLELVGSQLRDANERFVKEIHNCYKFMTDLSVDEISQYTATQIRAEDLISEIQLKIKQNGSNRDTASSNSNINIASKLPKMELVKFNGDVLRWYQFWDQFSSNVHNRNINEVDKLLYLQSVLEGDAKQAIEGLDTTNKNYQIAIKSLKERYGKPAVIIDAHYVALYRIKPVTSNQVKDCRNVLNEIERHLRVLSSLAEDVNHNHLRVMIMEKFPEDLIYEVRMKITDEDDSIDNIRKYLEFIISAKETSNRLKNQIGSKDNKADSTPRETRSDSFTLGSLHVKSETYRNKSKHRFTPVEKRNNKFTFGKKQFNKPKAHPIKRQNESSDEMLEPAKKKRRGCIFCRRDHFNDECTTYKTVRDRMARLRDLCFKCFKSGHKVRDCKVKVECRHCQKVGAHNRALCPLKFDKSVKSNYTNNLHVRSGGISTLLQTCIANIETLNSKSKTVTKECRILLDCGSQRSYITEAMASSLNLPVTEKINLSIFTFGSKSPNHVVSPVVVFQIKTRAGVSRRIYANVVPHITEGISTPAASKQSFLRSNFVTKEMIMADDGSCGDRIDILIGNDYYHSFMGQEKISVTKDLFLVNSAFGWVWSGNLKEAEDENSDQLTVLTYFQSNAGFDNKLNEPDLPLKIDDVKSLWDLESIGITDTPNSTRDEEAIKQFNQTVQFKDNRYHVKWPWVEFPPNLPNNLGLAWGRLKSLLKRLSSSEVKSYDQVIQDQLRDGIIEKVTNPDGPQVHTVHYLPHHCVRNRDNPNKVRIVYDASAKANHESQSLNECLYRGPLMLEDLTGLLIKFREHSIGVVADVEKAFLQLGLQDLDRDVTRFLWVRDIDGDASSENVLHLRFCRVPFGVISSPFLLNATIKFHLNKSDNPLMKQIAEDIYVDNIVTGARSEAEAAKLFKETTQAFDSLSMKLHDWNSNSKTLVSQIPKPSLAREQSQIKVLGLIWDTNKDKLFLKLNLGDKLTIVQSKRDILKVIASVYDPCGLAVPVLLPAKVFFQKLWKQAIKWDSKLENDLIDEWSKIALKFAYLKDIAINRYYAQNLVNGGINDDTQYELHCFTDSSAEAYATVVYLRISKANKNDISFVMGKSRLVPLKDQENLQVPRLELLGVLIGCRLLKYVMKCLRTKIVSQVLWTDSQIVLSWYRSEKLLPPFVSRRIIEIKRNKGLQLRYVPTKLNPADVGTRKERVDCYKMWLRGPEFLLGDSTKWPKNDEIHESDSDKIHQIQTSLAGEALPNISSDRREPVLFIQNADDSETKKILEIQAQYYPKESKSIPTNLSRTLQLFKDEDGVIKCKGRFKYTDMTNSQKEPILLPKNSDFTEKKIMQLHQRNYHVGVSHTLALLRHNFWVPHGRATVQRVVRKCPQCVKYGGGPFRLPAMPDLPAERVKLSVPFAFTGLDYFGPLFVDEDGRKEKRWVCLFTCLTIRAIHMEVVKDLSAEECLLAIRRFIASRGQPRLIMSDNAAQFKLTADVLASGYCIENKVQWKFIPELAPWFGGFYERLIGLVKHCMKRTLNKHLISHDQLNTVIKELEAVINTRPLTTVGTELEHVLTPVDFLRVGGPVTSHISNREFLEFATITKTNLIDGWKRGQNILSEFSKMFTNQYLTSLRERGNTHRQPRVTVDRAPRIGEAVQIKSDGSRAHWKVGKIVDLFKGSDGQIRVAKVKLVTGEVFTRSIGHLFPLEIDQCTVPISEQNDSGIRGRNQELDPDTDVQSTGKSPDLTNQLDVDSTKRQSRLSAIKAREKVKEWTSQLMMRLFES